MTEHDNSLHAGLSTSRRGFLKGAAALSTLLVVGVDARGALAAGGEAAALNPFVKIGADGSVIAVVKHFEMGQGTSTGLPTLIAEELDADWDAVQVEFAPADHERYKNFAFGGQGTGGSTAMPNSYMQYRQAAAAAREVLVKAAAAEWGVAPADVAIENGVLKAGERTAGFGEFAQAAAKLAPSAEPKLKSPDQFRLIGKEDLPRKDSFAKTDGSAVFAMDVSVPGMVYAATLRAPRFGGALKSFDATEAKKLAGFVDAKALPNGAGVAVYANSTYAAFQARDAITAEWDDAKAETRSTDAIIAEHKALLDKPKYQTRKGGDYAAAAKAVDGAAKKVSAEFVFPFLAHAPMEPLVCVIEASADGVVTVHDGAQFPGVTHPVVAKILDLPLDKVKINTVYAGGSFGRRVTASSDYQAEAAQAFKLLGGATPVKMVWSREDDIRGGYYRPMAAHRAEIGLDADGSILGWSHRIAAKSILKGTPFEAVLVHEGVDATSVEGVNDTHYAIPNMAVGLADVESAVPVLWWRSVGHTHTAFVMESLLDMVAHEAGADPVDYRRALLQGEDKDSARLLGALNLAAEKADWGAKLPAGRGRGIAVHKSFGTYVAQVVEVSLADGAVKVEKVVCAVDCGVAVNPDVIRAQMEGGIGYGLGAVMRNQVTLTDGEVDQTNFPDYEPLRIADMPKVEVHIVPSAEAPTGVGEPGVPPVGPALANAIFAATGQRVTNLPMAENGVEFA